MANKTFWQILEEELAFQGIKLINQNDCAIYYNGKFGRLPIKKVINNLRKRIKSNGVLFEETWTDTVGLLKQKQKSKKEPIDHLSISLFINNIKSLYNFADFLTSHFVFKNKDLQKNLCSDLYDDLNSDYTQYSKDIIFSFPEYKISLDWIFRKILLLNHIVAMLTLARRGPNKINRIKIKNASALNKIKTIYARGISGPWANLDLPTLERVYPYADIAEEMEGRRSDIRAQERYWLGFEGYNTAGVNEGFYWRELRNEPYLFEDSKTESPYPSRHYLWAD